MLESLSTAVSSGIEKIGNGIEKFNNFDFKSFGEKIAELDKPLSLIKEGAEIDKIEYDDNGNAYKKNGELLPNTAYEINGYRYKTDEQGRIVEASGNLKITERDNRKVINEPMENIGKGDEKETDDRGHLIGDQFDGSNKLENLVPMDANLNRGEFKALENRLAKAVQEGKEVTIKVEPQYSGDSHRPDSFVVTYSIDGEESVVFFENKGVDQNES